MAEYKPTAFDQLISVLPSLLATRLQFKLGQDRLNLDQQKLTAQKTQFDQNLAQAKDLADSQMDLMKRRDHDTANWREDQMILKEMELAKADKARVATQEYQANMLAEAIRKSKSTEKYQEDMLSLETRKQDEAFTKKDLLEWEEKQSDKKLTDVPLHGEFTAERNILNESDDWLVNEQIMINNWNREGFQRKLTGEVGRFQKARIGTPAYKDKIVLIDRLLGLRDAFDQPAFTEDKPGWSPWVDPGTSTQAEQGKVIVSQIDGLLSRLQ
mgnify:CR=1 FL=1